MNGVAKLNSVLDDLQSFAGLCSIPKSGDKQIDGNKANISV